LSWPIVDGGVIVDHWVIQVSWYTKDNKMAPPYFISNRCDELLCSRILDSKCAKIRASQQISPDRLRFLNHVVSQKISGIFESNATVALHAISGFVLGHRLRSE